MQTKEEKMECEEAQTNPLMAEIEAETSEIDPKNKVRRYWAPKEEERFFEIWGRDNWRLTRHGKNTIHFKHWSEELKERFAIDVKPEEIQAKVNQTRAKFRQVKKQIQGDKNSARWKKFDIVDQILKNQYRPEDAEPVPQEALENNRDISPTRLIDSSVANVDEPTASASASSSVTRQPSPTSITSTNSTQDATQIQSGVNGNASGTGGGSSDGVTNTETNLNVDTDMVDGTLSDHNLTTGMFNTSETLSSSAYNTELFSDQMDVKQEYDDDIKQEEFLSEYQQQYQQYQSEQQAQRQQQQQEDQEELDPPQLHQLQTPQQQQEAQIKQQQQQQGYQQYEQDVAAINGTQPTHESSANAAYDHSTNSYASSAPAVINQQHITGTNIFTNNTTAATASSTTNAHTNQYSNNSSYATNQNNGAALMQPPRPTINAVVPATPGRRRRAPSAAVALAASTITAGPPAPDSLEALYLEEVRRKNRILEEQKDISNKRLQLEERKVSLMEQFFPKCLELQEQILKKLNTT